MTPLDKRALARKLASKTLASAQPSQLQKPTPARAAFDTLPGERGDAFFETRKWLHTVVSDNPYCRPHHSVSDALIVQDQGEMINFSGYNYLGLAGDPEVKDAAKAAIEQYGTSCSASRLASGEIPIHAELEAALAAFLGAEAALVFNNGYGTNVSTIDALFGPDDAIVHDQLVHSSGLSGLRLSGSRRIPFRHNDPDDLERQILRANGLGARTLVVIEGAYSMDGDVPDLKRMHDICKRHEAYLMVDEAHSLGVVGETGRGICEQAGVAASEIDVLMGTLSKSLSSCGGYIAGSAKLIDYLRYNASAFVYSCGLSPADTASALAALRKLRAEPERVRQLKANAAYFVTVAKAAGLNVGDSHQTAVVPVMIGASDHALKVAERLNQRMINVQPVFAPTVEEGKSRLRFFISAMHTSGMIEKSIQETKAAIDAVRGV